MLYGPCEIFFSEPKIPCDTPYCRSYHIYLSEHMAKSCSYANGVLRCSFSSSISYEAVICVIIEDMLMQNSQYVLTGYQAVQHLKG